SIAGPLAAGFVLLPLVGEPRALTLLSLPPLLIGLALLARGWRSAERPRGATSALAVAVLATSVALVLHTRGVEWALPEPRRVMRDYEATSIAAGTGMERQLLINGVGITKLTPITKMMAHLPLARLERPPRNALIIAFGMGTTFRSALSWNIPTTAVDLVPSVPALFGFFHADADSLVALPNARLVVDDGRRFLERTGERFDVVIIDPPPPAEAVGSSLLYSADFYDLIRRRLRPGGILQQWYPGGGDPAVQSSVMRAIGGSFAHVAVYTSVEGWGYHILASDAPLPPRSAAELAGRLPASAAADLMEWGPHADPVAQFASVLAGATPLAAAIGDPPAPVLRDDRPVNEYYFIRRKLPGLWRWWRTTMVEE
ncbi:MAG TPA: hypothetical protein VFY16_10055, partial [Gemmatimonadaceae bacterium]|nr:hypothetical protein [Gemmatimonadaceae bacterium]